MSVVAIKDFVNDNSQGVHSISTARVPQQELSDGISLKGSYPDSIPEAWAKLLELA